MLRRWTRISLIGSLLCSTGLPVVVVQTAAWTKMAVGFSRKEGLVVSLRKVFDGKHACGICRSIDSNSRLKFTTTTRPQTRVALLAPLPGPSIVRRESGRLLASSSISRRAVTSALEPPPPKVAFC